MVNVFFRHAKQRRFSKLTTAIYNIYTCRRFDFFKFIFAPDKNLLRHNIHGFIDIWLIRCKWHDHGHQHSVHCRFRIMFCQIHQYHPVYDGKNFSAQIRFCLSRQNSSLSKRQCIIQQNKGMFCIPDFFKSIDQTGSIRFSKKADHPEAFFLSFRPKSCNGMFVVTFSSIFRTFQFDGIIFNFSKDWCLTLYTFQLKSKCTQQNLQCCFICPSPFRPVF